MRWRIDLAYDGTDFHGWASQPGLRTVQGILEEWIPKVLRLGLPTPLTVAGRTDAGVHARAQVAHFDLPGEDDIADHLHRRLDRVLPADLVVRSITPAPQGFDARFSAIWRRYCYRLWDPATTKDPLRRFEVAQVNEVIDVELANRAARLLLGLRDFAPFCKPRDGATTIRTLLDASTTRDATGTIAVKLVADAFCHSMVRSIVGALVAVGTGRRNLDWLSDTAALSARAGDVHVMAACGLTLEAVGYPEADQLADRAIQARNTRTLEQ